MHAACIIEVLTSWLCTCPNQVKQAALGARHADTANTLFHLAEVRSRRIRDMRLLHSSCLRASSSPCCVLFEFMSIASQLYSPSLSQPAKLVMGALMIRK